MLKTLLLVGVLSFGMGVLVDGAARDYYQGTKLEQEGEQVERLICWHREATGSDMFRYQNCA